MQIPSPVTFEYLENAKKKGRKRKIGWGITSIYDVNHLALTGGQNETILEKTGFTAPTETAGHEATGNQAKTGPKAGQEVISEES